MTYQIYQDLQSQYRRRIVANNNKIVGASSEGFVSKSYCEENAKQVMREIAYHYGIAKRPTK